MTTIARTISSPGGLDQSLGRLPTRRLRRPRCWLPRQLRCHRRPCLPHPIFTLTPVPTPLSFLTFLAPLGLLVPPLPRATPLESPTLLIPPPPSSRLAGSPHREPLAKHTFFPVRRRGGGCAFIAPNLRRTDDQVEAHTQVSGIHAAPLKKGGDVTYSSQRETLAERGSASGQRRMGERGRGTGRWIEMG